MTNKKKFRKPSLKKGQNVKDRVTEVNTTSIEDFPVKNQHFFLFTFKPLLAFVTSWKQRKHSMYLTGTPFATGPTLP
jgi:hypothetical protein